MTYALSEPIQAAIFDRLVNDVAVSNLVGAHIFDAPIVLDGVDRPADYVTIGAETVRNRSSNTSHGALHDLSIVVHSNSDGFQSSKRIAGAICDALLDATLPLSRGDLVYLRFLKAKADTGDAPVRRKITLQFRAFAEDS